MLENYKEKYKHEGKFIFVPNYECIRKGLRIVEFCRDRLEFPDCFYHYRNGGHVAALHRHLDNRFFFRIDLQNFYYAISRNRVCAALHASGFHKARTYGKWSCVRNPVAEDPRYSLPIGFVQSPALASLVLMRSPIMGAISAAERDSVFISVYLDDLIGSSTDFSLLERAYYTILEACGAANLQVNARKLLPPASEIHAFNCVLKHGLAEVTDERIRKFVASEPSDLAEKAFIAYCLRVQERNFA
ncbi:reverse transcriptase domain-containing protein [Microvirga massiliensis]|uniref:reverse transcriptase domain-containing protein n=1 Tax=Microvirga massiliensis TaxID=1033741 RepID=UPI000660A62D|nr:reverse transcriptase domain-containing protein [Microvirga massiliensis]